MTTGSDNLWLAVDVGNSQIKAGWFAASTDQKVVEPDQPPQRLRKKPLLPECLDFHVSPLTEPVDWDQVCSNREAAERSRGVIVGSNQRGVDRVVKEWPDWLSPPLVIRSSEAFPLEVLVDEPGRVGLDRLLNAIAAGAVRDRDAEVIVVDCGTATTVDLVSAAGSFCGGAILPGFTLCARALNQYTEVLPLISMDELFDLPASEDCHPALGSNTQAAIMSGPRVDRPAQPGTTACWL